MSATMQQVLAYLTPDEPRYAEAANLGLEAIPHLTTLLKGKDVTLAAKAAYLAGLIDGLDVADVMALAVSHHEAVVRLAGTSALPFLPVEVSTPLLRQALNDDDSGVRRVAYDALPQRPVKDLWDELEDRARAEKDPGLRLRAGEVLARWRSSNPSGASSSAPRTELVAAFPLSDNQIMLRFAIALRSGKIGVESLRSDCGIKIREAHFDSTAPNQIILDISPPAKLPLVTDCITISELIASDGRQLGALRSPRFIHGVHTPMELKVPYLTPEFPFRSTLVGLYATLECCTGCNGGIHDRDLVVVNNHTGGGWSGIWVRTAKVIEGPYPRWQRVMFAGGILTEDAGSLALVDDGQMVVQKGDERPHHAPPPMPIRSKDIPGFKTESLVAKSLDGVWVELNKVNVLGAQRVTPKGGGFSRNLSRLELCIDDGSGRTNAWLYQPSSHKIAEGQTLSSLRGFVHAEEPGVYVLLSDKDEDVQL